MTGVTCGDLDPDSDLIALKYAGPGSQMIRAHTFLNLLGELVTAARPAYAGTEGCYKTLVFFLFFLFNA